MIKFIDILKEDDSEFGKRKVDPTSGVTTIFKGQDPDTGKMSWDVENTIDMEFVHNKIKELIKYMENAEEGSQEDKVKKILKYLSVSVAKLHEEQSKGLWHNIRAKRERGEKPARKGSEAYKKAVKAAKEINKNN